MGEPRFSAQTSLELIDDLNMQQIDRELEICDPNGPDLQETLADKKQKLRDLYCKAVFKEHDKMKSTIDSLTTTLSRYTETIGSSMEKFTQQFEAAQTLLSRVQQQPPTPSLNSTPLSTPLPSSQEVIEPGNGVKPYADLGELFADMDINRLNDDTEFPTRFANRTVGYYGEHPYKYAGGFHNARPMADNPYLTEIAARVQESVPGATFNSAAITKYEHSTSHIPPHQDNESQIVPGSSIVCVSLGATRDVVFRSLPPARLDKLTLTVRHGGVYTMSRESQDYFDHSVPPSNADTKPKPAPPGETHPDMRISITFRMLRPLDEAKKASRLSGPPMALKLPSSLAPAKPIRVLLLSDSKNRAFDSSLLKEPIVAFRKDLFYLRDLRQHMPAIAQSDVVLISSGLNDIRFAGASPQVLDHHLRALCEKFPNVQFIFDSIAPVALRVDPNRRLNNSIDHTNNLLMRFAINSQNFKLFDCVQFGLGHLAHDGIHLTNQGQKLLSETWVRVILITLRFIKVQLPIRRNFRDLVDRFGGLKPG